jgi:exodeoxyribonuclease VII small subunit
MIASEHREDFVRWKASLESGGFEEVFQALGEAVVCLETGNLPLEDAIQCYELGARLAECCSRILSEAELRVSRLDTELLENAAAPLFGQNTDLDDWNS